MSNKPHLSVSKFMMGEKEYRLSGWFSPNGLWNEEKSRFDPISQAQEATIREAVNILAKSTLKAHRISRSSGQRTQVGRISRSFTRVCE